MNRLLILNLLMIVLVGCAEETPQDATLPSPLLTADGDRLWILLRASRVGDGRECEEHYLLPDDPRYQGLQQKCGFWSRNFADYLAINGYPTIEHQHLQERAYWEWYVARRQAKFDCVNALGTPAVTVRGAAREEHRRQKNACDPYDDALNNQKLTPDQLGIQYP